MCASIPALTGDDTFGKVVSPAAFLFGSLPRGTVELGPDKIAAFNLCSANDITRHCGDYKTDTAVGGKKPDNYDRYYC